MAGEEVVTGVRVVTGGVAVVVAGDVDAAHADRVCNPWRTVRVLGCSCHRQGALLLGVKLEKTTHQCEGCVGVSEGFSG